MTDKGYLTTHEKRKKGWIELRQKQETYF